MTILLYRKIDYSSHIFLAKHGYNTGILSYIEILVHKSVLLRQPTGMESKKFSIYPRHQLKTAEILIKNNVQQFFRLSLHTKVLFGFHTLLLIE